MKNVVLVKLGGSIITDKTKPYISRPENIEQAARSISKVDRDVASLIIGTGAGSFGHYPAQKYGLDKGVSTKEGLLGFSLTQSRVTALNNLIVESLIVNSVPAVPIHPSSVMQTVDGRVSDFHLDALLGFLDIGLVPVVHGDIVMDESRGGAIVSTETVFEELCKRLPEESWNIQSVVYISTDKGLVGGSGEPIEKLDLKDSESFDLETGAEGYDVTGGMKTKLEHSSRIARLGIPVYILGYRDIDKLSKIVSGEHFGTLIS